MTVLALRNHDTATAGEALAAFLAAGVDSDETRRAYERHLRAALASLDVYALNELTPQRLAAYRAALLADGRGHATHAAALPALRSFLRWSRAFGAHGLRDEAIELALRLPRVHVQRPYTVLSEPEVGQLLDAAGNPRDRALLAVLLGAGLRASESVALDVADVREDELGGALLYVRQGKGRKDRIVPVRDDVAALVREYLEDTGRTLRYDGPLFRAHDRGASHRERRRLSSHAVGAVVKRCCADAGIVGKRISPHSLRHTFAVRALRGGANVHAVSKLLGHSSIQTTARYLDHLELDDLRAQMPLLTTIPAVAEWRSRP